MPAKVKEYFQGLGRRKTSVAQVRLQAGGGLLTINDNEIKETRNSYFGPLILVGLDKKYNVSVHINGGGFQSQRGAIQLGIARALLCLDKDLKPTLRKAGFLTRDPREKERKKPGLKGARRAPQWSKR